MKIEGNSSFFLTEENSDKYNLLYIIENEN
jgi:hypothetical protein